MKLKKDAGLIPVRDFWNDLFEAFYISPGCLVEDDDAKRVKDAIKVLKEFKGLLESEGVLVQKGSVEEEHLIMCRKYGITTTFEP